MKVFYHDKYNIDLGPLNYLHPFDGKKFLKVHKAIRNLPHLTIAAPSAPIDDEAITAFVDGLMRRFLNGNKRVILDALEVPYIPFLPFSVIDSKVLLPMRWGVAGTLAASIAAVDDQICWNLSGGYHHASQHSAQGFCIYNDIGIAYDQLIALGKLRSGDRVLIIDIDAHHGNGNARTFQENEQVVLLDIYNEDIYPTTGTTRNRVDVSVPLPSGTTGAVYLEKLEAALNSLEGSFRLAFIVAGTDVLSSDPLGRLGLSIEDCVTRDRIVLERLRTLSVPAVVTGGGGYSKDSSTAIIASINSLVSASA